jgi:hypothetical protein
MPHNAQPHFGWIIWVIWILSAVTLSIGWVMGFAPGVLTGLWLASIAVAAWNMLDSSRRVEEADKDKAGKTPASWR